MRKVSVVGFMAAAAALVLPLAGWAQCQGGAGGCENETRNVTVQLPFEGQIPPGATDALTGALAGSAATVEEGAIHLTVPLRGHGASVRLSALEQALGEDARRIHRDAIPLSGLFGIRISGLESNCCAGRVEETLRGIEGVQAVRIQRNEDATALALVGSTRGITFGAVRRAFETRRYRLADVEWYACCKLARGESVENCCRLTGQECGGREGGHQEGEGGHGGCQGGNRP